MTNVNETMAERSPKSGTGSFPSRQMRQGPAPLASFEDLSDEIESPTEKNSHPTPEIQEKLKLFADAATPSTPHLLATTPSTPRADLSSASTPRVGSQVWHFEDDGSGSVACASTLGSRDGSRDSILESSREVITTYEEAKPSVKGSAHVNGIKNSVSSSFMDDVRGAEAASALASSLPERSATPECLPHKGSMKKSSLTSSHLSGQGSRTPSRTPSPKSPRRFFSFFKHRDEGSEPGSPSSPKSPRKSSFTNLFKSGRDDHDHGASSPTKKKPTLSVFFKGGKKGGGDGDCQLSSKGKKEASNRNMFSTLFKKGDKKLDRKSPVKVTLQASSVDIPIELDTGLGTGWTSREISLHSHLSELQEDEGVTENDSPRQDSDGQEVYSTTQPVEVQVHASASTFSTEMPGPVKVNGFAHKDGDERYPATETATSPLESSCSQAFHEDYDKGKEVAASEDKISSGSEQESDFDPVSLKKRVTSDDYEAETLIHEEGEYDEFPPPNFVPMPETQRKRPITPIRRQRHVDLTTIPIERPRSSTPLSVTSLEAYIQTASPPLERSDSEVEKLKVCLPGEEFSTKGRSPRKTAVKNWQDFCHEVLLHSPRARRKDSDPDAPPSMAGVVTAAMSAVAPSTRSWVTFDNLPEVKKSPRIYRIVPECSSGSTSQTLTCKAETESVKRVDEPLLPEQTDNANTARLNFVSDQCDIQFPDVTSFTTCVATTDVDVASSRVSEPTAGDLECHKPSVACSTVNGVEVLPCFTDSTQPDVISGEAFHSQDVQTCVVSDFGDDFHSSCPSIPDVVTNTVPTLEGHSVGREQGKGNEWSSNVTRSSSASSSSGGNGHIHLDSVEGIDPLLGLCENHDDDHLISPLTPCVPFEPQAVLYPDDDEKRPGGM